MGITGRLLRVGIGFLTILLPSVATAQSSRGVVTMLSGHATVARRFQLTPEPLRFKDALFEDDRISTAERSLVRVLLGGKALVTVRELSVFTITEKAGSSSVQLAEGKLAASVAHSRMRHGEAIEIRTPNAIAAVRGTVVVVEVLPPVAPGMTPNTLVTVTRGVVGVTPLSPIGGAEVSVRAGQVYDVAANHLRVLTPDEMVSTWDNLVSEPRLLGLPDDFSRSFWRGELERTARGTALAFSTETVSNLWALVLDQALRTSPLSPVKDVPPNPLSGIGVIPNGLGGTGVTPNGSSGAGSLGRGCGGGVGGGAGVGCAGVGQGGARGNGN